MDSEIIKVGVLSESFTYLTVIFLLPSLITIFITVHTQNFKFVPRKLTIKMFTTVFFLQYWFYPF